MQLTERVHLVSSGSSGFDLTDPWDAHAYLLDGGDQAVLVDVGLGRGVDALLDNVASAGVDPTDLSLVLITHAHPDHCGGAAALARRLPGVRVAASAEVAGWVAEADAAAMSVTLGKRAEFYPEDFTPEPCEATTAVADGEHLACGQLTIQAVATPGHAAGHLSFFVEDGSVQVLLAGDLVFYGGGISLLNTWDCDLPAYVASLRRFRETEVDVLLPGHHSVSLGGGQRHLDSAIRRLDAGFIPPSIV